MPNDKKANRDVFESALDEDDDDETFEEKRLMLESAIMGGIAGAGLGNAVGRLVTKALGLRRGPATAVELPVIGYGTYSGARLASDEAQRYLKDKKRRGTGNKEVDRLLKMLEDENGRRK